jgi:hypothetical protein
MHPTRHVDAIFSSLRVSLEPNPTPKKQIPRHLIPSFQILPTLNPSICKTLSSADVFFQILLQLLYNWITNVDSLLRLVVFCGLHLADCFGGLQFVEICVECVWLTVFTFGLEESGLTRVLFHWGMVLLCLSSPIFHSSFSFWGGYGVGVGP